MKSLKIYFIIILFFLTTGQVLSNADSLIFKNGNIVVGEIKGMERGVLEIDADYGDENFKIKWLNVKEIYTQTQFLIRLNKNIHRGRLATLPNGKIEVISQDSTLITCSMEEIVYLTQIEEGFANRFSADIEVGFNLTRDQNLRQFSSRSSIGYKADRWLADASYNQLRSTQDEADDISRIDGEANLRYLLLRTWYGIMSYSVLSNNEQNLDLRNNIQVGVGKFLYSTNKSYWSVKIGYNHNNEQFTNESSSRNSSEAYFGTIINLYDVGDLELWAEYIGYSGLSDFKRYRSDTNIDVKYDLPLDFFIRTGFSINYDNQPAFGATNTSYILRTGIGWEW